MLMTGLFIFILLASCKREEEYNPPSDPQQAIKGKWKLISTGNWPQMHSSTENDLIYDFGADSLLNILIPKTGDTVCMKYCMDSLLRIGSYLPGNEFVYSSYSFSFFSDKMLLDWQSFAYFNSYLYQRQ
jgi:hypothetical protein